MNAILWQCRQKFDAQKSFENEAVVPDKEKYLLY